MAHVLRAGIAADHCGFALKAELTTSLRGAGYEIEDYGADEFIPDDDYPDLIIPLAWGCGGRAH
jgi:ribose 5-phosphate isomerase B